MVNLSNLFLFKWDLFYTIAQGIRGYFFPLFFSADLWLSLALHRLISVNMIYIPINGFLAREPECQVAYIDFFLFMVWQNMHCSLLKYNLHKVLGGIEMHVCWQFIIAWEEICHVWMHAVDMFTMKCFRLLTLLSLPKIFQLMLCLQWWCMDSLNFAQCVDLIICIFFYSQ